MGGRGASYLKSRSAKRLSKREYAQVMSSINLYYVKYH